MTSARSPTYPFPLVQADGTAKDSVAASMTMQLNDKSTAEDIRLAKILPGNMYLGGADTVRFVNLESLSLVH
jgi:hypothetical protein